MALLVIGIPYSLLSDERFVLLLPQVTNGWTLCKEVCGIRTRPYLILHEATSHHLAIFMRPDVRDSFAFSFCLLILLLFMLATVYSVKGLPSLLMSTLRSLYSPLFMLCHKHGYRHRWLTCKRKLSGSSLMFICVFVSGACWSRGSDTAMLTP